MYDHKCNMSASMIWIVVFLGLSQFTEGDLFVNKAHGHDTVFCGVRSKPCKTLKKALSIHESSMGTETIVLEPDVMYKPSNIYRINSTFALRKNLHIKGSLDYQIKPRIVLNLPNGDPVFQFPTSSNLLLQNLQVLNASKITNFDHGVGYIKIRDCKFEIASMLITNNAFIHSQISINIFQTTFHDSTDILHLQFLNNNPNQTIFINISQSNFFGGKLGLKSKTILIQSYVTMRIFNVEIEGTKFQHFSQAIRVTTNQKKTNFTVRGCNFIKNNFVENNNANNDLLFCGSGIRFTGPGKLNIFDTNFKENEAVAGGGLCLFGVEVDLKNVHFIKNFATSKGGGILNYNSTVIIDGCNFHKNVAASDWATHKNDVEGYGGAIFNIFNGVLLIYNSRFTENHAYIFGGSIYHNGKRALIANSTFSGPTHDEKNSLHGTLLYSKNSCLLEETSFVSQTSNGKGTVIFHSSDEIEFEIKPTFRFQCKRGQKIIRSYNHQPRKTKFSLLILICQPCPVGTYSLQRDILHLNHSEAEEMPFSFFGCQPCPQGGICENGIYSLPNFWGWETKDHKSIEFLSCPSSSYCCTSQTCTSYNECGVNRVGRLCGKCRPGFGENMFGRCILEEACNGYMLWTLFIICSICYVFLFMYFKDIFSMTKLLILKPVEFVQRLKRNVSRSNLDDLDMFYVDIDHEGKETLLRVDSIISRRSLDHDIDDSDIMQTNDFEDSYEEQQSLNGDNLSDNDSIRERLISNSSEVKKSRAAKIKIKWYSYLFGIFKILVFFYQMQLLCKVPSVLEDSYEFAGPRFIKEFVTGIFNLKLSASLPIFEQMCLFKGMDPISRRYAKVSFIALVFVVLAIFLLMWRLVQLCKRFSHKKRKNRDESIDVVSTASTNKRVPFMIRIKCCFLQLILISYSTICTAALELIHCINIGDESYVYINAEQKCEGFGYTLSMIVVACWAGPFFIALFFANRLLRGGQISVNGFFVILLAPPLLIIYFIQQIVLRFPAMEYSEEEKETREHVLQVLEMPFHKKNVFRSAWYWESNLIFRKLVLICTYVFFKDPSFRLYGMVIPLSLFLVDHLRVQPYNIRFLNWLETASLLLLSFLVSLNLFWAYNYESNVAVTGKMNLISKAFLYIETFILFLPILLVLFIVAATIGRRLLTKMKNK